MKLPHTGVLAAVTAYTLWGVFPLYWKMLKAVPTTEILGHRVIWTVIILAVVLTLRRDWRWVRELREQPVQALRLALSGALLAFNWLTYIWAINAGYIVEASLGYFINPLVSVLLGVFLLQERLRPVQWMACALALAGVLFLALMAGGPVWISLVLAGSFGIYGLAKKKTPFNAFQSLFSEMAVLFVPALLYAGFLELNSMAGFGALGLKIDALLIATGIITALPLLAFAAGARRVKLSTLGLLQYIAPTLQFLIGVLIYGEDFSSLRVVGFCIIWTALLIYSMENVWFRSVRARSSI